MWWIISAIVLWFIVYAIRSKIASNREKKHREYLDSLSKSQEVVKKPVNRTQHTYTSVFESSAFPIVAASYSHNRPRRSSTLGHVSRRYRDDESYKRRRSEDTTDDALLYGALGAALFSSIDNDTHIDTTSNDSFDFGGGDSGGGGSNGEW